ncbi:MAG TPA: fibronectin type III domain-containing protein [Patescibacteria group bacterium]
MSGVFFKRTILPVFITGLLMSVMPLLSAKADDHDPHIKVNDVTVTSKTVFLPITWKQYFDHNVDVKVKVRIRNEATGAVMFQLFDTRVNGNGHNKVTVTGLKPGTTYSFKVAIRKITLSDYSDYSNKVTVTTAGAAKRTVSAVESSESTAVQQQESGASSQ